MPSDQCRDLTSVNMIRPPRRTARPARTNRVTRNDKLFGGEDDSRCDEHQTSESGSTYTWSFSTELMADLMARAGPSGSGVAHTRDNHFDAIHILSGSFSWAIPPGASTTVSLGQCLAVALIPGSTSPRCSAGTGHATMMASAPVGTASEAASMGGHFFLEMDNLATSDLTWALSTSPSAYTDLPGTVVVATGESSVAQSFEALQTGSYSITAVLLDAYGNPTSNTLTVSSANSSTSTVSAPTLFPGYSGNWSIDGPTGNLVAAQGGAVGNLVYERSGFSNYATQPSTVSFSVSDPSGILSSFPSTATIATNTSEVTVPVTFTSVSGVAHITASIGSSTCDTYVESKGLALVGQPFPIAVPVGGWAYVGAVLSVPDRGTRTTSMSSSAPSTASVPGSWNSATLDVGDRISVFEVEGQATGTATLSIASSGLTTLPLTATVFTADVAASRTSLTILSPPSGVARDVYFELPDGAVFASVTPPSGSSSYLTVSATGTGEMILHFTGASAPSTVACTCTLSGAPTGSFDVLVADYLHGRLHPYYLPIP